jgi:cell wall-associated NlpC family hydrolase
LDLPDGSPAHAKFSQRKVMLEWLKGPGQLWFKQRADTWYGIGDLLLVRYGHVSHHLAMALSRGRVVHVCTRLGVQIIPTLPARWRERVDGAFFPVEVAHG